MKFDGNMMRDVNTCNHNFTQKVKPTYSMTAGEPCSKVQMTYQEARERANQLSH